MSDPYPHLHVASGYSLQYGASHPHVLVERAAEQEMDTLALTDRDGTYGAVKFAKACQRAGIRPVLGVNLAYRWSSRPRQARPTTSSRPPQRAADRKSPVRGGAFRDLPVESGGLPRATFLAAADTRGGRAGWAAVCRLISAVQLAGERGAPTLDLAEPPDEVAELLSSGDLMVLLGPASDLGVAATRRRDDLALAALEPWRALVPRSHLVVEMVSHRLPGRRGDWGPGTTPHAARMAGIAREAGLSAVLTNAVRYADRRDAVTVDVLDAARRLVALDRRHLDRGNAEGFLKSGKQMQEIAEEICRVAGLAADPAAAARQLLA
ncbi:MAG TPA: PHP domain-containing protein, partial [Nocardioides sp.]|nr:PHP domain-containing protein [Nocardioides sp.]